MMKYYKKTAVLLILVLSLFTGLIACGNSTETAVPEEEIVEETAPEAEEAAEEPAAEEIAVEDAAPEVVVAENEPVAAEEDFAE